MSGTYSTTTRPTSPKDMRAGAQTTGANPPTSPRCRTQTLVTTWLDSPHKPILGKRKRRNPDAQHYRNGLHKARFASSARHVSGNRSPLGYVLAGSGFGTVTRTDPVTRARAVRYHVSQLNRRTGALVAAWRGNAATRQRGTLPHGFTTPATPRSPLAPAGVRHTA